MSLHRGLGDTDYWEISLIPHRKLQGGHLQWKPHSPEYYFPLALSPPTQRTKVANKAARGHACVQVFTFRISLSITITANKRSPLLFRLALLLNVLQKPSRPLQGGWCRSGRRAPGRRLRDKTIRHYSRRHFSCRWER